MISFVFSLYSPMKKLMTTKYELPFQARATYLTTVVCIPSCSVNNNLHTEYWHIRVIHLWGRQNLAILGPPLVIIFWRKGGISESPSPLRKTSYLNGPKYFAYGNSAAVIPMLHFHFPITSRRTGGDKWGQQTDGVATKRLLSHFWLLSLLPLIQTRITLQNYKETNEKS